MDKLKTFEIAFKGLAEGKHEFDYGIDSQFFEVIEDSMIEDGNLKAKVLLDKQTTILTLDFDIKGIVKTLCDRCLDPLELQVKHKARIYVKFGEEYDEPSDEIIVLPHDEHQLNVAHLIYEFIGLSLPVQRLHEDNSCDPQMIARLDEFKDYQSDDNQAGDPRWDELKKLLDKNK
ncbi:MAG: DUF177 domain-containing protein [Breznakibacter sp.]